MAHPIILKYQRCKLERLHVTPIGKALTYGSLYEYFSIKHDIYRFIAPCTALREARRSDGRTYSLKSTTRLNNQR